MHVKVITKEKEYDMFEYLEIDGVVVERVFPLYECPEDAIIGRDLVSCSDIAYQMEKVKNAMLRGEEVTFEHVKDNNYDE